MSSIRDSRQTSGFLDSESAITSCFPGTYSTIGLNRMALNQNRWQRSGASSMRFVFISGTNGRWSVSSLNSFNPTKYLRNFSHAQTPASISFSIWAYRCSVVVSVLEGDWLEDSISRLHSTDSVTACIRTHYRRFRWVVVGQRRCSRQQYFRLIKRSLLCLVPPPDDIRLELVSHRFYH